MLGYIMIGIFAVIIVYIAVLYFLNSKKIKKNSKPKTEQKDKKPDANEKVEVKAEISAQTPIEQAINEANDFSKNTEIEKAFAQINAQRELFEKTNLKKDNSLKKDRDNFKTELQMAMESNRISSETNKIGKEGPSKEQIERINLEIELENQKKSSSEPNSTIANEISKMSPEAKAILINDILGKKY